MLRLTIIWWIFSHMLHLVGSRHSLNFYVMRIFECKQMNEYPLESKMMSFERRRHWIVESEDKTWYWWTYAGVTYKLRLFSMLITADDSRIRQSIWKRIRVHEDHRKHWPHQPQNQDLLYGILGKTDLTAHFNLQADCRLPLKRGRIQATYSWLLYKSANEERFFE